MRFIHALSAALVVALHAAVRAQDARLAGRLDAATLASVSAIVDSARTQGIPADPLVEKALQGAAKHADGARIVAVVSQFRVELAASRGAIGAQSTEAEIVAGASALHAGASPADLSTIRHERGDAPLTVPLGTLADLVAQGVPVNAAVNAIETLASRNAADGDYLSVRSDVASDVAQGASPAAAAHLRASGIAVHGPPAGVPPGRGKDHKGHGKP